MQRHPVHRFGIASGANRSRLNAPAVPASLEFLQQPHICLERLLVKSEMEPVRRCGDVAQPCISRAIQKHAGFPIEADSDDLIVGRRHRRKKSIALSCPAEGKNTPLCRQRDLGFARPGLGAIA
jgi:hypothetical protein